MTYKPIHVPEDLYFITGTTILWLPISKHEIFWDIILRSLTWHRQQKRMLLFAFVIMPTHLHWISKPLLPYTINDNIRSFASFTAHKILLAARVYHQSVIIRKFAQNAKKGKNHRIWLSFQAKNIYTDKYLRQKMEYIHNNPIKSNWFQFEDRTDYDLSSACYYDLCINPIIPIDDIHNYIMNIKS